MKKYPIDKAFFPFSRLSAPMFRPILTLANAILKKPTRLIYRDADILASAEKIGGYGGGEIELIILRPKNAAETQPCLLYLHGGGFVMDAAFVQYRLACEYAKGAGCTVVMVRYRLAPKYPYPIPAEDCYRALKWVTDNAEKLSIDPQRIAVGGDSAGGNLAAVTAQMARDRMDQKLLFQLLIYPVTDRRMQTQSMREFTDTPMWNARLNQKMWEMYLQDMPENIAYASPIEAESFAGLPPAYIETAEYDCLRDEGILYAERLRESGIDVLLHETKATMHGFEIRKNAPIVRDSVSQRIAYMRSMFEKGEV